MSAAKRVQLAVREAVPRCLEALSAGASANAAGRERENLLASRVELERKQTVFATTFDTKLEEGVAAEMRRHDGRARPSTLGTGWQSLSLVDDREVELQVGAERISLTLQHHCEWELRELDALMIGLLQRQSPPGSPRNDAEPRNPLRPEIVGKALVWACDAITDSETVRRVLTEQLARSLASAMPALYGAIAQDMKSAGIKPLEMSVRTVQGPGNELGQFTNTGYDTLGRPIGLDSTDDSRAGRLSSGSGSLGPSTRSGAGSSGAGSPAPRDTIGQVDADVMALIRRLAVLGNVAVDTQRDAIHSGRGSVPGTLTPVTNLILANREELQRTATGSLDHMVIDVVGSLFDQILADPKVPPQMARHIARLQLPVLRAALGDATFFSSRRHPVRKLVNRMASLAVAFEDFSDGPGQKFLALVRELVDEIVGGDFDQMALYEQTLDRLESFIAEQAQRDVEANSRASSLLDQKEIDLLLQQRYMQQLQAALAPVPMEEFLRQFLTQVWTQALMKATQLHGADSEHVQRLRLAGRDLVMSVQAKGSPTERKAFLMRLPQLMKDINEGIALIGWSQAAKKDFFDKLMPAHAQSLKGESLRTLDYNLLVKQLDAILATPLPKPEEATRVRSNVPVLEDIVSGPGFTPDEAARIGLVDESAIDWSGEVDIDLSAEPEVSELDINIDGLPPPDPVEPTHGASLADHVQIGFSYRMHFENQWHKVRLSHISPGRTFFVFTRGAEHQHAISMTARMLARLCDTGRLRAFENAYLIERATARARAQLAALRSPAASTGAAPTRH